MSENWPDIRWVENGAAQTAAFIALRPSPPPSAIEIIGPRIDTGQALSALHRGTTLLWRGDWPAARTFLTLATRRLGGPRPAPGLAPAAAFAAYRAAQAARAQRFGRLLVPLDHGAIALARAQPLRDDLRLIVGELPARALMPLRDVLAAISAGEWRRKGVPVAALGGAHIHPHFGVFPPTRQDYVDLVAGTPLPPGADLAFDLGTGSGILGAVLLHRGVPRLVATDNNPRAIACAADNLARLGFADRVELLEGPLFPPGRAPLIVVNPPWLPVAAETALESAVYDPDSAMLRAVLAGLPAHLTPGGEAWLILSDLAEHLGLRAAGELAAMIAAAGLTIREKRDTPPAPKGAAHPSDPLYFARSREIVSLYRLGTSQPPKG